MKKSFAILIVLIMAVIASAGSLTNKRIYLNPGHGSFGPNDRPMATIPYPNLKTTGMPDTVGFYESNTNLWKCLYLRDKLVAEGAYVMMSRTQSGPWPYQKVNGDYPDYTTEGYKALSDYEAYNRPLSEICEEVEANSMDLFLSIHSNASTDGTTTNYPLALYRGNDNATTDFEQTSKKIMETLWPYRFDIMGSGMDPNTHYSSTNMNVRGDISFYGSSSTRVSQYSGKSYTGYLGVLKHGAVGGLWEGYFHTYQPARHRALNPDYCHMEGLSYYRGICDYYEVAGEQNGYIMGTVKDMHNKIKNSVYQFAPKTNDQWIPCNGAVVTLFKAGQRVADYTVDTLYNGIFVFENLVPGNDYTLDVTCAGYKPLTAEYKTALVVKANETTYPFLFLEDTGYVAPTIHYTNYPDPVQPSYLGLSKRYEIKQSFVGKTLPQVLQGKTIRRTLYRNGNVVILALDATKEPTLVVADATTQQLLATLPTDFCSVNDANGFKLSDIAFTADGYLIGCNMEQVHFTPSDKLNVYRWQMVNDSTWTGKLWFAHANNETAGNYYDAYAGRTIAYSGSIVDGFFATTATTIGSSKNTRLIIYSISDSTCVGAIRNGSDKWEDPLTTLTYGENLQMIVSPHDSTHFILTSDLKNPVEWIVNNTTNTTPAICGVLPFYTRGVNCFRYAHHSLMTTALFEGDSIIGFALYDISQGLGKAKRIDLGDKALITAIQPAYAMAAGDVSNLDFSLYLVGDTTISKVTTSGVDQPVIPHISAYDLRLAVNNDTTTYTFTFTANDDAASAALAFYKDGEWIADLPITVKKGANSLTLADQDIPGSKNDTLTWSIQLNGDEVANWGRIHAVTGTVLGTTRPFVSINNQPESPYFQYMYMMDRKGSANTGNGLYAFKPDYSRINTNVYKGSRAMYGSPYRTYVDDQGYIWISDGSDGYSQIVVANPDSLEGTYQEFFQGTRDKNGLITNGSVEVGSSSLGLSVYGTGKDARLLTVNEDGGTTLKALSLAIYNIGSESGIYKHTWGEAPSKNFELQGMQAFDGYPLGCTHGVWIATRRSAGNNNASATALQFYDWDGTRYLSSAVEPYKDEIDGSFSGACALTEDESVLYFIDGSKHIMVYDIVWEVNKPVLTLRYSYDCGIASIREMHLDWAGNLVCSGEDGFFVFTIPTTDNSTTVPASSKMIIVKQTIPTGWDEVRTNDQVRKILENGQVVIIRDGKRYNITGQMLR